MLSLSRAALGRMVLERDPGRPRGLALRLAVYTRGALPAPKKDGRKIRSSKVLD